jgi:hypothetical protein
MDAFIICVPVTQRDVCFFCAAPRTWELHGSNNPNRKYGVCENHRSDAITMINVASQKHLCSSPARDGKTAQESTI